MRCKVGDLVIVTSFTTAAQFRENLGRFGTVERPLTETEQARWPWAGDWDDAQLTPIPPNKLVKDTETEKQLEHS